MLSTELSASEREHVAVSNGGWPTAIYPPPIARQWRYASPAGTAGKCVLALPFNVGLLGIRMVCTEL